MTELMIIPVTSTGSIQGAGCLKGPIESKGDTRTLCSCLHGPILSW